MFVFTTKLNRKKLALLVVIAGVLLCGIIIWVANLTGGNGGDTPSKVSTNDERVAYLSDCGWNVVSQPIEYQEVRIPDTFDEVFTTYNELQMKQGFDLNEVKGKRVMRYTYTVLNHPSGEPDVRANMLVYKDRVVGGDVCSADFNGFMEALTSSGKSGGGAVTTVATSVPALLTDEEKDALMEYEDMGEFEDGPMEWEDIMAQGVDANEATVAVQATTADDIPMK